MSAPLLPTEQRETLGASIAIYPFKYAAEFELLYSHYILQCVKQNKHGSWSSVHPGHRACKTIWGGVAHKTHVRFIVTYTRDAD